MALYGTIVEKTETDITIRCPKCSDLLYCNIADINCKKFVHAINPITMFPCNPHKKLPPQYIGCGCYFKIRKNNYSN